MISQIASPSDQREAILDSAFACFARYGYRRTALGDIARESGLSRPALYHYFANKEAVFSALSQRINREVVSAITRAAAVEGDTLSRLLAVLEARIGWAFDLLHVSEHGRELVDEKNRICANAGVDTDARFVGLITSILRMGEESAEIDLASSTMAADAFARFIIDGIAGVLAGIHSEAEARHRLRTFVTLLVGGLKAARQPLNTPAP